MQTLKQVAKAHRFAAMQPAAITERQALDAAIDRAINPRVTPKQVAAHLKATGACSIGETEHLADVHSDRERHALWFAHQDTFKGPTQTMIDAVMADCHRRIARACNAGLLSLWASGRVQ